MVNYFLDRIKWHFNQSAVRALDFNARLRQCLCRLHTADDATHAVPIRSNNLYIILAVQRLESG